MYKEIKSEWSIILLIYIHKDSAVTDEDICTCKRVGIRQNIYRQMKTDGTDGWGGEGYTEWCRSENLKGHCLQFPL